MLTPGRQANRFWGPRLKSILIGPAKLIKIFRVSLFVDAKGDALLMLMQCYGVMIKM